MASEIKANTYNDFNSNPVIVSDGSGNVTIGSSGKTITNSGTAVGFGGTNTPAFSANNISTSITASLNTAVKATFDNELFDTANAYNTATSRFTVPSDQAGKYHFTASLNTFESTANNTSTGWSVYFYKNGSNELFLTQGGGSHTGNARMNIIATTLNLSVGDYIEVYFRYNASSGNASYDVGNAYNRFSGFKIIE